MQIFVNIVQVDLCSWSDYDTNNVRRIITNRPIIFRIEIDRETHFGDLVDRPDRMISACSFSDTNNVPSQSVSIEEPFARAAWKSAVELL